MANNQSRAFDLERDKHLDVARTFKIFEADLSKAREELKEMIRARDCAESGLAGAQKQAQDQARRLPEVEDQLKIAK